MAATRMPGTPRLLRVLNDRAALELLLARGPLTRAQLGELTGLSKVTASQMVERLEQRGLVRRVGEQAGGRGPNAQLYAVTAGSAYVIGVEIGNGRVLAACADLSGTIAGRDERPLPDDGDPDGEVRRAVAGAAERAGARPDQVRRVVLGTPGLVDPAGGEVAPGYDPPAWHQRLLLMLRAELGTPDAPAVVLFGNDVNLAATAEAESGAAVGADDFVLIWIDSGVGLAAVIGGRVHRGSTGAAGEIGWLPVPGATVPRNGTRQAGNGAFQTLAGADAVRTIGQRYGFGAGTGAGAVRSAVDAGAGGAEMLDELAGRLALGVAAACVVLDPPLVVLGGAVGRAGGPELARRVRQEVVAITPAAPSVVATGIETEAVLHGALRAGLDAARNEIFDSATG